MIPSRPVWTPRRWNPGLGQADPGIQVVVIDAEGTPVKQALVSGGGASAYTDEAGIVRLAIPGRSTVTLTIEKNEYRYSKMVQPSDEQLFVTLPVRIAPNGIKTAEVLVFIAGIGLVGAGAVWKLDPLKMVGEIVVSGVIFSMIYRLAAR